MSEADKMFEELGYAKEFLVSILNDKQWGINYKNIRTETEIIFDEIDKEVCISDMDDESIYISMQELQAINEKCKELGWL